MIDLPEDHPTLSASRAVNLFDEGVNAAGRSNPPTAAPLGLLGDEFELDDVYRVPPGKRLY